MAESLILPAKKSIEELQQDVTRRIQDIDIPLPKKSIEELQLDVTRRIQEKCQLIFFYWEACYFEPNKLHLF